MPVRIRYATPNMEDHSQTNEHNEERNKEETHEESPELTSVSIPVSKYTEALIERWQKNQIRKSVSSNKISVSQTVSFAAFLYEKMRNAVEFREEHLIRRATIERIIKRRLILNGNGRDIAEPLIKELLWARYYENNTIGEEKISEVQSIIDKYFFLRNELARGRKGAEHDKIANFMLEVMSCEIEENLSPDYRREAFTNYVYQQLRQHIGQFDDTEMSRDTQVYIAVEKTFAHSDLPLIRYHLLKLYLPEIVNITWKTADKMLPQLYDIYTQIENDLKHIFGDKIRNKIKKQIAPYLIMRDIFEQNLASIKSIMTDEAKLKFKVDQACRKRYDESRSRLSRTAIRSFIYILLTKVIFAFIIEIPYDLYLIKEISYIPMLINVIFPPILMTLIIMTVTIPGDDNTRRIYILISEIISTDPDSKSVKPFLLSGVKHKSRSLVFTTLFSSLYLFTYLFSFGSIIYILTRLSFNPVSQAIFIFFVTLVTFFAFKVIQITQEYSVVEKEGFFTPLTDFIFLPIIRVGQWLSGEVLARFNVLIFVFDFIIEMPFKAIVEVFDEWVHFVRLKKEEIV